MGKPRGLARSTRAPAPRKPTTAAFVDAFLKNSLLEIVGIHSSSRVESGRSMLSQCAVLSHDFKTMEPSFGVCEAALRRLVIGGGVRDSVICMPQTPNRDL
jgi:hypothetical protein